MPFGDASFSVTICQSFGKRKYETGNHATRSIASHTRERTASCWDPARPSPLLGSRVCRCWDLDLLCSRYLIWKRREPGRLLCDADDVCFRAPHAEVCRSHPSFPPGRWRGHSGCPGHQSLGGCLRWDVHSGRLLPHGCDQLPLGYAVSERGHACSGPFYTRDVHRRSAPARAAQLVRGERKRQSEPGRSFDRLSERYRSARHRLYAPLFHTVPRAVPVHVCPSETDPPCSPGWLCRLIPCLLGPGEYLAVVAGHEDAPQEGRWPCPAARGVHHRSDQPATDPARDCYSHKHAYRGAGRYYGSGRPVRLRVVGSLYPHMPGPRYCASPRAQGGACRTCILSVYDQRSSQE